MWLRWWYSFEEHVSKVHQLAQKGHTATALPIPFHLHNIPITNIVNPTVPKLQDQIDPHPGIESPSLPLHTALVYLPSSLYVNLSNYINLPTTTPGKSPMHSVTRIHRQQSTEDTVIYNNWPHASFPSLKTTPHTRSPLTGSTPTTLLRLSTKVYLISEELHILICHRNGTTHYYMLTIGSQGTINLPSQSLIINHILGIRNQRNSNHLNSRLNPKFSLHAACQQYLIES